MGHHDLSFDPFICVCGVTATIFCGQVNSNLTTHLWV